MQSTSSARICAAGTLHGPSGCLWPRRIGILGGLGPFAHLDLEQRILASAARRLGRPPRDQDLPHWVLASLPHTPDRTASVLRGEPSPVPCLLEGLRLLSGADFAVIACNTAHIFIDELRAGASIPIVNIVEAVIRHVSPPDAEPGVVGLLASSGTIASGLYQQTAAALGARVTFITPLDVRIGSMSGPRVQQHYVTDVIFGRTAPPDVFEGGVKAGAHATPRVQRRMQTGLIRIVERFRDAGARTVILGCTEIPLALGAAEVDGVRFVNPLAVAAEVAVAIAAGAAPMPA